MKLGTLNLVEEKRRAPRMPVAWDVRARVLGEDEPLGQVRLDNVSKGGMAVTLDHAVERESVVKLSFTPNDGEREVHAYATVAWTVMADHPQAGLRFMGIDEKDEERLASLVERWVNSGGSRSARN
jgi:c-di-GMP-binding flagellar brake protein YcgR